MTIYAIEAFKHDRDFPILYRITSDVTVVTKDVQYALVTLQAEVILIREVLGEHIVQQPLKQPNKWTEADKRTTT